VIAAPDGHPWLNFLFDGEPWSRVLVEVKVTTHWVHERIQRTARKYHVRAMKKLWDAMFTVGARGAPGGRLELMKSARVAVLIMLSINLDSRLTEPRVEPHWAVFNLMDGGPGWGRAVETSPSLYQLLGYYSAGMPRTVRPRLMGPVAYWRLKGTGQSRKIC
jgi:hypothetical protein